MAFRRRFLSRWIVSTDGYRVRYLGRAALIYDEPGRRAAVGVEVNADGRGIAVFSRQVRLNGSASHASDDEIVQRVAAALRWEGWTVEVV